MKNALTKKEAQKAFLKHIPLNTGKGMTTVDLNETQKRDRKSRKAGEDILTDRVFICGAEGKLVKSLERRDTGEIEVKSFVPEKPTEHVDPKEGEE